MDDEFQRLLNLAALTLESAVEHLPDELPAYTAPVISTLNSIVGPAQRAREVLYQRHTSLTECIPFILGATNEMPKRVHVVIVPAADGDGVRLMAFEDEAAAEAVLETSGSDARLASLLIDQEP